MLGFGVSGEEVYIGSGVYREGNFGVYLPKGSYVGNSKVLCERDFWFHTKVVDFGRLYLFQYYTDWP